MIKVVNWKKSARRQGGWAWWWVKGKRFEMSTSPRQVKASWNGRRFIDIQSKPFAMLVGPVRYRYMRA
jgi:hypothetical protein